MQSFLSWEAYQSSINKWVPYREQLKCWCKNTNPGLWEQVFDQEWQQHDAWDCSAQLQGSTMGAQAGLGLSNRDHRMQCVEYTDIQVIPKKVNKQRKKVLLNLFLSWRLHAPVAEFEGKQGCLASWELLAGREMPWRSSPSFIFPSHRSQISQGSTALALLPPVQVPLSRAYSKAEIMSPYLYFKSMQPIDTILW